MKALLEKYYNGETTAAEEAALKAWLQSEEAGEAYAADRALILGLAAAKEEDTPLPDGLGCKLEALIDEASKEESQKADVRKPRLRRMMAWTAGIAASVALVFGAIRLTAPENYIVEVDDPEEARRYTEMALTKFSDALQSGYAQLDKASKALEMLQDRKK